MTQGLFGQPDAKPGAPSKLGRGDRLTFRGNLSLGRHGWLRLTPAYSLHLVRELLEDAGPDALVLEPFSGTGTTPLACSSQGIRCHAVDVNPFLVWLGNLKLSQFNSRMSQSVKTAARGIVDAACQASKDTWKPDLHAIEKWWDAATLRTLAALCHEITILSPDEGDPVADLLRVAFCRVMIQTANVSFGHQSMSFKKARGGDEATLVKETDRDCARRITRMFIAASAEVADSLAVEPPLADCKVLLGDSRDLQASLPERRYTSVITSPPYPNRMSYIRELRPYMYWLGYLSNGRAAGELDWKAIGGTWGCATSLLNTWTPDAASEIPFSQFTRIVKDISSGHALLGRYVHKYFEDMKSHLTGLQKVLASGARCHYIVGNSKFYDTMLPVEQIYAAMFEDAGFLNVTVETIRKRSSKKELFEFIVHAQMP